mgnify:CR=1 FL=1
MRILFDSKQLSFKDPFGTLIPGQNCTLHIHIPETVPTEKVESPLMLPVFYTCGYERDSQCCSQTIRSSTQDGEDV